MSKISGVLNYLPDKIATGGCEKTDHEAEPY